MRNHRAAAFRKLKEDGAQVVITVDCGITAFAALAAEGGAMEFVTVNPSLVLGPLMAPDFSTSLEAVKKLIQDDGEWRADPIVVPGDAFGAGGEDHVRCAYATAPDQIEEALRRIAEGALARIAPLPEVRRHLHRPRGAPSSPSP